MIKKALASTGIALALIVATPFAVNAATNDTYVPASAIRVSDSTPVAGQPVTVSFDKAFAGSEDVRFSVTGEGAVTIAAVTTASVTKAASANGSVSAVVTPPSNASGTYTVTATGLTSNIIGSVSLTVVAADGTPVGKLAYTGGNLPIAGIWIAGGVLALGIVLVVVVAIRRRSLNVN